MKNKIKVVLAMVFIMSLGHASASQSSPYAGEETREIKALSQSEVDGLLSGKGMGYAKAAELNGYPGPAHVLELKDELSLTEDQRRETEMIFSKMEAAAKDLGGKLVEAERALDDAFKSKKINEPSLSKLIKNISDVESSLRAAHLIAHLQQRKILSDKQISKYIALRGYVDGGHGSHHKHHHGE